jgi:cysteinyl-tRNA synthetase
MVDGKKMSKSEGNFYTLSDIEEKFKDTNKSVLYRAIRLGFINAKYSSSLDFSFSKLEANINAINSVDETLKLVDREIKA